MQSARSWTQLSDYSEHFFEFYLFVSPLGYKCYQAEQALLDIIQTLSAKTELHILCYHNHTVVSRFLNQLSHLPQDLETRNRVFQLVYDACLAYKAASLQGKRKAREFLLSMQREIAGNVERFTTDYALDLAQRIGLDVPLFETDWRSDYVRKLYLKDQQIAHDMNAQTIPSLVAFEHSVNTDGVLLTDAITCETILEQLSDVVSHCPQKSNSLFKLICKQS
ncbi:MAG: DsbA family protein [Aerococcaceae bacterium]|nr:DsbA family protein [Aerococcaceae bacterium]